MESFGKPSEREEEYFARKEYQRRKKEAASQQAGLKQDELSEARKLHHMKCPKCGMDLAEMSYHGVTIDKCTACEGIWLDSGELETLLAEEHGVVRKIMHVFGLKD